MKEHAFLPVLPNAVQSAVSQVLEVGSRLQPMVRLDAIRDNVTR
jgi:hypothetical protein